MQNPTQPDLDQALSKMPSMAQSNVSEGMTSAGRLDQMLGSDSPLMKRARTQGLQQAQQRGLLNSSMAAGASQGAMIDRAQPFALQDSNNLIQNQQFNAGERNRLGLLQAGLIGDSYRADQGFGHQTRLAEQGYGHQRSLNEQQFGHQTQLADQGYEHNLGLNDQRYGHTRSLNAQQYGFQRGLNDQQHGQTMERDAQQFDNQQQLTLQNFQNEMARMGYAFDLDQVNVSNNFASGTAAQTLQNIQSIQADPNLEPEAKQAAIDNAVQMANQTLRWASSFYSTPLPGFTTPGQDQESVTPETQGRPDRGNSQAQYQSLIDRTYRGELGRAPDPEGMRYWMGEATRNGWDEATLAQAIRNAA